VTIGELFEEFQSEGGTQVILDSFVDNKTIKDDLVDVFETGEKEVYEIELDNGITLRTTLDHKFMCSNGLYHTIQEIFDNDLEILSDSYSM
jgi:DNA polymerase-3 subunit alpha